MGNHKIIRAAGADTVRYSMYDFIEYVHSQPVIWDHHHEGFHNREQREEAWHNVAGKLFTSFDGIKHAEKQNIVQTLTKRWKNTRDSYLRSFRLSQSNEGTHSYIYENELHFLRKGHKDACADSAGVEEIPKGRAAKSAPKRASLREKTARKHKLPATTRSQAKQHRSSNNSNFSLDLEQVCSEKEEHLDDEDHSVSKKIDSVIEEPSTPGPGQKSASTNSNTNFNALARNETKPEVFSPPVFSGAAEAVPDADQAFFDSIKPVIRKMSEDKKLDFQIEVLKLLKNFRSN